MPVMIDTNEARCALTFSGELNIYNAAETMAQVKAELSKTLPLHLELAEVDEVDAAGLQILMAIRLHALSHGVDFQLANPSDAVMDLIELSDTAGFFGITQVLTEVAA
ncbi:MULTISPECIES: STAS domain-containing protein [unclassified Methylophilus]|jgi:anti-sigma B factor antagonist|uniref:STAS domain-containing protein n=1 Tax=unclassified Methylophilus TaxID=2630143 RepID=UPI00188E9238|nr:STAS domain-containing protein [Methylophilus sp. 13]MBF5038512.1 STAS domain-containing protein [Methylophilus sp. 13]BEV07527.1 STAS domain-containing protein [Methylophilus sp. DW102]